MTRAVEYAELFRLALRHPFYADGRSADFAIRPDEATRGLLRNHRAILKQGHGHVRVLTSLDDTGQPFIPFPPEAAFYFALVSETSELEYFTDLADFAGLRAPRFTSRGSTGGTLRLEPRDPPVLPRDAFAEVEVRLTDLAAVPAQLEVAFRARQSHWAYYCLTDLDAVPELEIVDSTTTAAPLLFSDANRRDLAEEPDPTDSVALRLAERYPELRRIRFVSDEPVDSRQLPDRHLGLRRGPHLLTEPLPTPAVSRRSKIDQQVVLYQIVRFLTHPFPQLGE